MPKVSVIIPVYNTETYLRKCLDSVCNQTLSDIEIICVNDCSTDNSIEILKEYSEKDNRLKFIELFEHSGAAKARNIAINLAKSEYLGFVDSDDWIDLDFYEKLYNTALETKSDVIKSNLVVENFKPQNNTAEYHNIKEVQKNKLNLNHIPTTLIKKTFLEENNIVFPENLKNSEDTVFEVMVAAKANQIEIVPEVFYHYRFNNKSLNNTETYSIDKITNLLFAFEQIVDFLNSIELPKKIYESTIINRFNIILNTILEKAEYDISNISAIENEILKISSKVKGGIIEPNPSKIKLIKKVALKKRDNKKNIGTIPKRIFYVWGANEPLRDDVQKYISTWRKYLPDYEIIQINEDSKEYFDFAQELKNNQWFRTVYSKKMWAYVSDYIRIKTLYDNGGIYFDTDVEVLKSFDDLLKEPAFVGIQDSSTDGNIDFVEPAILGAQQGNLLLAKILCFYDELIWEEPIYTMPEIFAYFLKRYNITPYPAKNKQTIINLDDITIYPEDYFIPFRYKTEFTDECIKDETRTIHWWGGSWVKPEIVSFLNRKHLLAQLRKRVIR